MQLRRQLRRSALAAVDAIAVDLRRQFAAAPGTGIESIPADLVGAHLWHLANQALFFAYLSVADAHLPTGAARHDSARDDPAEQALTLLEVLLDALPRARDLKPSLFYGVSGLGWTLHHVARLLDAHDDGLTDVLDAALLQQLSTAAQPGQPYDLMDGLVGIGVYAFEASQPRLLRRVVEQLENSAHVDEDGYAWWIPEPLERHHRHQADPSVGPRRQYNLGLAHGSAGVVAFLADVLEAGVAPRLAARLLRDATRWLLAQRLDAETARQGLEAGRAFPWAVYPEVAPLLSAWDPGWAYADSGIAWALLRAARALREPDLERQALDIARAETERLPSIPTRNPGIGYGPAGFALLYQHLWRLTDDATFDAARLQALEQLLALRDPDSSAAGQAIGGFASLDPRGVRQANSGLLGGAAGIGLVLLTLATDLDPTWDRLLLLSPPRPLDAPA